jgi:hypothetical protein
MTEKWGKKELSSDDGECGQRLSFLTAGYCRANSVLYTRNTAVHRVLLYSSVSTGTNPVL